VTFVGRLGTYRYYNMDQVVGQALALFNRIAESEKTDAGRARVARGMARMNGTAHAEAAQGAGD
jgi:UDP-galactopyranose mutase